MPRLRIPIFTIGHSTRPIPEFARLLQSHGVELLVDIRTIPKSRHNPQYGGARLRASLARRKIGYRHLAELGGLRKPMGDSVNTGWRNRSFRGYADHMQSPEFHAALEKLLELARGVKIAIMCAEAVPWRCHRNLVADTLVARGIPVAHIMSETRATPHRITPWARVKSGRVTYPAYESGARAA
jgi:uncharacterized protein (DUF488 family)